MLSPKETLRRTQWPQPKDKMNDKNDVGRKTHFINFYMTQHGGQSAVHNESKQSKPDRVYRLRVIDLYREHAGRDYPKCFGKSLYKLQAHGVAPTPVADTVEECKREHAENERPAPCSTIHDVHGPGTNVKQLCRR